MNVIEEVVRSKECYEDDIECRKYQIDLTEQRNITFFVVALYKADIKAHTEQIQVIIQDETHIFPDLPFLTNTAPYFKKEPHDIIFTVIKTVNY